jgi:23S rRNA (cytosine1962-C5)-methyltransferase
MLIVRLKPGKEGPLLQGHPWVYSGAVDKVQGEPEMERLCRVLNARGQFVCQGMYNPVSQLAVRVLTMGKEVIDRSFFHSRIKRAVALRNAVMPGDTTCCRLINAEGDLLPGLVVDRYNDILVMQVITPGVDDIKGDIVIASVQSFRHASYSNAPTPGHVPTRDTAPRPGLSTGLSRPRTSG